MLRLLIVLCLLFQATFLFPHDYQVSLAAIFQNEAPYLKEWIDYHRLIGVEHFWLYNDTSSDHWAEVLAPYIEEGIVEVIDWSECRRRTKYWSQIQIEAYKDALKRSLGKTKWLAIIDTDEFILPLKNKSIQSCLRKYFSQAKAVYMQWIVFGTSGAKLAKNESMLRRLTFCSKTHPWSYVGKTIVRPEHVLIEKVWYPHHVPLKHSFDYTDGSGKKIPMEGFNLYMQSHQGKYIRINHYFFRDEKFYREVKLPRKLKRGMSIDELSTLYEICQEHQDFKIIDLLNKLSLQAHKID